jgi:hypothetical protein
MQLQQKPPKINQSNVTKPKPKQNSWLWLLAFFAGIFFSVIWPTLQEEITLRFYTAPASVILLANDTHMSAKGRRIFYLTQPQVTPSNGTICPHKSEKTIVLGCYFPRKNKISIQAVEDPRLDGVMQVTAAHEMLHAAYHRLSYTERKQVDRELATVFSTLKDRRVKDNIALYESHDPKVVPNELHSILATEVAVLNPFLENYYKQYFTDRSAVVKYAQQSAQPFAELTNEAEKIAAQLQKLKLEIKQLSAFNTKNGVDSMYAQKVDEYNILVNRYNTLVNKGDDLGKSLEGVRKN